MFCSTLVDKYSASLIQYVNKLEFILGKSLLKDKTAPVEVQSKHKCYIQCYMHIQDL